MYVENFLSLVSKPLDETQSGCKSLLYSYPFVEEIAILAVTGLYLYFNLVENAFSQACFYVKRAFLPKLKQ